MDVSDLSTEFWLDTAQTMDVQPDLSSKQYLVWVLDTYTDITCSNNRNQYYKAAWIPPLTESSKALAIFSASTRSAMTIP